LNALRSIVATLALAVATPGFAQVAKPQPAQAPSAAGAIFAAWDVDHNGVLSGWEFQKGWESLRDRAENAAEARLRQQFDKIDANGNGGIDAAEYGDLSIIRRVGKSAPPLSAFDANQDQRLQFEEYLALLRRLTTMVEAANKAATP
jgi:hypothetical protein